MIFVPRAQAIFVNIQIIGVGGISEKRTKLLLMSSIMVLVVGNLL